MEEHYIAKYKIRMEEHYIAKYKSQLYLKDCRSRGISGPFMNPSDLFLAGEIINGGIKLLSKDITQIGHFRRTYKFDTAE